MRMVIVIVALVALAGGGLGAYEYAVGRPSFEYHTMPVHKGNVIASISATGTIEPEETVDVGAQVAGQIMSFGKDSNGSTVDYNSPVEPGMVLARIDDTVYKADADVAQAQLEQARTAIQKAEADLAQAKAKLLQSENDWNRAREMGPSDALSQNDYDMYHADYETAKANVAVAQSEIAQAQNGVPLAQAELDKAKRNLDYCTITSPVRGIILDRRVNVGQTVVSSLNTPSLFLIGRDLSKMQIWASVNEADIGRIKPNSPVTFSCDSFPDRVFKGTVFQIRDNATMSQNVVLYTVVVNVDNYDHTLIPYLTAKVQFEVARQEDSLIVPNMALRWTPSTDTQVTPSDRAAWRQAADNAALPPNGPTPKDKHGTVYVKDGDYVKPIDVILGVTDRITTAITSSELKDNDQVVVGDIQTGGTAVARNPFVPPARSRR